MTDNDILDLLRQDPLDPRKLYAYVLDTARKIAKAEYGNILLIQPIKLSVVHSTVDSNIGAEIVLDKSFCGHYIVLDQQEYAIAGDLENRAKYSGKFYAAFDISGKPTKSEIAVGVYSISGKEKYLLGIINLESHRENAFSEEMIPPLKALAEQVAIVLIRAADYGFERAIAEVITEIADSNLDVGRWHESSLKRILHILGVSDGQIMSVVGNMLHIDFSVGDLTLPPGDELLIDDSLTGSVVKTGKSIRINDLSDEEYRDLLKSKPGVTLGSEMAVPLKFNRAIVGLINVQTKRKGAFSPRHQEMLERLASLITMIQHTSGLFNHQRSIFHALRRSLGSIEARSGQARAELSRGATVEVEKSLEFIGTTAGNLAEVANRLLQYPNLRPVKLGAMLDKLLPELTTERQLNTEGITWKFEQYGAVVRDSIPVVADEIMFRTVLGLLLDNSKATLIKKRKAIAKNKFQGDDRSLTITITQQIHPKPEFPQYAEVLIKDTGLGIPKERLQGIFRGNTVKGFIEGSGYGLPDARRMMNSMFGRIYVLKSKENQGTTFSLPIKQVEVTTIFSRRENLISAPNFRVLLFTRNQQTIDSIGRLKRDNLSMDEPITTFGDVEVREAVELLRREPTLVIIDHTGDASEIDGVDSLALFDKFKHHIQGNKNPQENDDSWKQKAIGCDVLLFWNCPTTGAEFDMLIKNAREDQRHGYLIWEKENA